MKKNIMKTAIQLVAENLLNIKTLNSEQVTEIVNILSMAMEKEKQDLMNAATHGANFDKSPFKNAEDYYNETFK